MIWKNYPDESPNKIDKYLVVLRCEDRQWVSVKPWGKTQVQEGVIYGHRTDSCWFLGMEFEETQVIKWCPIPPYN